MKLRKKYGKNPSSLSEEDRKRAEILIARDARKAKKANQKQIFNAYRDSQPGKGKGGGKGKGVGGGKGKGGGKGWNSPAPAYAPAPAPAYAPAPAPAPAPASPGGGVDIVSQLEKLSKLHQLGALDMDEYKAAKGKLLASM
jgi:hypothetical protein